MSNNEIAVGRAWFNFIKKHGLLVQVGKGFALNSGKFTFRYYIGGNQ